MQPSAASCPYPTPQTTKYWPVSRSLARTEEFSARTRSPFPSRNERPRFGGVVGVLALGKAVPIFKSENVGPFDEWANNIGSACGPGSAISSDQMNGDKGAPIQSVLTTAQVLCANGNVLPGGIKNVISHAGCPGMHLPHPVRRLYERLTSRVSPSDRLHRQDEPIASAGPTIRN